MDLHCQMILDQYRTDFETFQIIHDIVKKVLNGFVTESHSFVNTIEARIKTEQSLIGKLELKGHKYKKIFDITDLVGARIVTFYGDEVDRYAVNVEQTFDIDWDNSVDKRKLFKTDEFGYLSLHYICRIPKSLYNDPNHPLVNEYRFEIQIRSILQHAWATIYHDTGYKSDIEVPKEYLRALNRLAGLLEIADQSFIDIRNNVSTYRHKVKQLISAGSLQEVELNGDSFREYIEAGAFESLTKKIALINNMDVEKTSPMPFLKVFKLMGYKTLNELEEDRVQNKELGYQLAMRYYYGKDLNIISSNTGMLYFAIATFIINGGVVADIARLFDYLFGEKKSNLSTANKIMSMAESMGILKKEQNHEKE